MRRHGLLLVALLLPVTLALANAPVVVNQLNRAFSVRDLHLARGDVVRFSNTDEFLHHLYVRSPGLNFNSGEQPPGRTVEIQFPTAGRFDVRCEIHPRMQLSVTVE